MLPDMTLKYIVKLTALGYDPHVDDDGDIFFRHDDKTWLLFIHPEDPMFFRVVLPNFWPIESEAERQQVFRACSVASALTKVAKVFVVKDNVWAAAELLLPDGDGIAVLPRCLETCRIATSSFVEQMRAFQQAEESD